MKIFLILTSVVLLLTNINETAIYNNTSLLSNEYIDSCTAAGQLVCMNCVTVGECQQQGSGFIVVPKEMCKPRMVCDPSVGNACFLLGPSSSPVCRCDIIGQKCFLDPSDSLSYINCVGNNNPSYFTCASNQGVDLSTCTCQATSCPACGSKPNPNTDCTSFINCRGGADTSVSCFANFCFEPTSCNCEPPCPACGFKPGTDETKYIYCEGGVSVPMDCYDGYIFNRNSCECELAPPPCPDCGYTSYPGDNTKYIYCGGGTDITYSCPNGFIFDSVNCVCDQACPSCGFKEYPGDNTKYIDCGGGTDVIRSCPSGFIFDSTTCSCDPVTSCPSCGYKEYPGDNTKYIKCSDNAVGTCPTSYTFDPYLCYCTT